MCRTALGGLMRTGQRKRDEPSTVHPFIVYRFNLNEFSMLCISLLNILSIFSRVSTCVQLWITVEWSRPPTSFPMREAGILVYFCAKYIDT